jgi:heme-degrading monooxygenase HmoA
MESRDERDHGPERQAPARRSVGPGLRKHPCSVPGVPRGRRRTEARPYSRRPPARSEFVGEKIPLVIARIWRGAVRRSDGDAYADYIKATGFDEYKRTPGNRGAWMLRRDVGELTEFITFSLWDSIDAVKAFAGEDYEAAKYYPEDDRFLVERDDRTAHYEVEG